jgi:phosphoenolpyruvate carboxylase
MHGRAAAVQLLLDEWGQPAVTADVLVQVAITAADLSKDEYMRTLAALAKELHKLYPAQLQRLLRVKTLSMHQLLWQQLSKHGLQMLAASVSSKQHCANASRML